MGCDTMINRMDELIENWDTSILEKFNSEREGKGHSQGSSKYFLESHDKCNFFLEPDAVDPKTGGIFSHIPKREAINKAGHGVHWCDDVFRSYTHSTKVGLLVGTLGWRAPVAPQSMYIFKQPRIGGAVTSHQDSTYLFTEPRQTCLGLWLALEDATETNGCLWARPGSHKEPVRTHWCRNPEYWNNLPFQPDEDVPEMMNFKDVGPKNIENWDGTMPSDAKKAGFVAVPMKAGSIFLIHGELDHLTFPNTSSKSRHTFQLHLVEGPEEGVQWSAGNWLQLPEGESFPRIKVPSEVLN